MYGKIKSHGKKVSIAVVIVMLVTSVPFGFIMAESPLPEPDHNGQAKGIAATTATAATIAGTAIGAVTGYSVSEFFSDGESATEEQVEGAIDNATNDTLREGTHSSAIISEGSNEGFLDNVDNDQATIEGQVEQMVNSRIIKNGDNYTTQAELVQDAEAEASTYLKTRQINFLETHNFHVLSLKQYTEQLDTAGFAGDIKSIYNGQYRSYDSDVVITDSDTNQFGEVFRIGGGSLFVDLNGNSITTGSNFSGGSDLFAMRGDGQNLVIKDGTINISGVNAITNYNDPNDLDVDLVNVDINVNNGTGIVNPDPSTYSNMNVYNGTSDGFSVDGSSGITIDDNNKQVNKVFTTSKSQSITFNETKIANQNSKFSNGSDVPTAKFKHNNETVTLPAHNITLDSSYMGTNNTVKVATPYKDNGDAVINSSSTVVIETTTSGIGYFAEPVDFPRAFDILTTTDDVASTTYNSIQTYAEQVWTDYLQDIASDDSKSVYDNSSISEELGTLTYGSIDPSSPEQAINQYTGTYEGTTAPWTDVLHIKELSTGDTHVGALYSTDMTALMEQTPNVDKVEEGDTFDVSTTNRTFVLNQDTAEKNELEGEVEVTLIEGKESADVRDYEMESTNLADQAQRLQDASEAVQQTTDNPGSYVPDLGGNSTTMILVVVALVAGFVILKD